MKHVTDRIQAWLSGELGGQEASSLEAHLEQCPACAEAAAEARRLWEMLAEADPTPAGPSIWPEVRRRTVGAGQADSWFFGTGSWARSSLATAAVAAGLLVGVIIPGSGERQIGGTAEAEPVDGDQVESLWLDDTSWDSGLSGLQTAWLATGDDLTTGPDGEVTP
jgi:anti-sigma factor RsiW